MNDVEYELHIKLKGHAAPEVESGFLDTDEVADALISDGHLDRMDKGEIEWIKIVPVS
jgi:hypothetical protein